MSYGRNLPTCVHRLFYVVIGTSLRESRMGTESHQACVFVCQFATGFHKYPDPQISRKKPDEHSMQTQT